MLGFLQSTSSKPEVSNVLLGENYCFGDFFFS